MKQQKKMTLVFVICLVMTLFSSISRADEATQAITPDEMTQEDQEILAALNEDIIVTMKPAIKN